MRGKVTGGAAVRPYIQDHPRVCGEKRNDDIPDCLHLGSPPRMRGKAQGALDGTEVDRITPAYAGKSVFDVVIYALHKDHPRVCGEKTKKIP